jgi:protein-tyrosine phosphatase
MRNATLGDSFTQEAPAGKRVLVTCHMGINRSASVAALSLMQLERLPAGIAIERVRSARGPHVPMTPLCNSSFVEALHFFERKRGL